MLTRERFPTPVLPHLYRQGSRLCGRSASSYVGWPPLPPNEGGTSSIHFCHLVYHSKLKKKLFQVLSAFTERRVLPQGFVQPLHAVSRQRVVLLGLEEPLNVRQQNVTRRKETSAQPEQLPAFLLTVPTAA